MIPRTSAAANTPPADDCRPIFSRFDHIAGWLDYRQSASCGGSGTRYLNYAWDQIGNLTQRRDENQA